MATLFQIPPKCNVILIRLKPAARLFAIKVLAKIKESILSPTMTSNFVFVMIDLTRNVSCTTVANSLKAKEVVNVREGLVLSQVCWSLDYKK